MELTLTPRLSIFAIRARYFSAIERADSLPDFIAFCNSAIVTSSMSAKAALDSSDGWEARAFIRKGLTPATTPLSRQSCRNFRRFTELAALFFFSRFIEALAIRTSASAIGRARHALKIGKIYGKNLVRIPPVDSAELCKDFWTCELVPLELERQ